MARPESVAIGGYYPTPTHLIPKIAGLLRPGPCVAEEAGYALVDPCAGDGEATCALAAALFDRETLVTRGSVYACELEESRAKGLEAHRGQGIPYGRFHVAPGDAFRLVWSTKETYGEDRGG